LLCCYTTAAWQLNRTLLPLDLEIKEIPSDGNCLFRAISDQIQHTSAQSKDQVKMDHFALRALAAQHIRSHRDDYEPYLEEGTNFATYCTRIASSVPVNGADVLWGGQIEIQALSVCLQKCIEVYSAEAPVLRMGATASGGDGDVLRVSYHAHFFALGAHYNSVVKKQKQKQKQEQEQEQEQEQTK